VSGGLITCRRLRRSRRCNFGRGSHARRPVGRRVDGLLASCLADTAREIRKPVHIDRQGSQVRGTAATATTVATDKPAGRAAPPRHLPRLPPIVRNQPDGRELTMARWGMPSPLLALKGKKASNEGAGARTSEIAKALHDRDQPFASMQRRSKSSRFASAAVPAEAMAFDASN
jgi:hypothetical protein